MDGAGVVAMRTQYFSRPGRRVIVVKDLASLRGPVHGIVELPLWLYWSGPDKSFNLGEPSMRRWLYQIVLREASRATDLTGLLNQQVLVGMWPELYLPQGVRQAWADHHRVLRATAAASLA